jgi:transposase
MYSLDFINKVLKQRTAFSIKKLSEKYDISTRTIQNWIQGKLPQGKRNRPNTKLEINLLIENVKNYPDSYQYERAERLCVSEACIYDNLKRLNITYKKTLKHPKADEEKHYIFQKKNR